MIFNLDVIPVVMSPKLQVIRPLIDFEFYKSLKRDIKLNIIIPVSAVHSLTNK